MKKLIKNPFFLVLLGVACIYIGFKGTTDKPMCNDVEMKPEDKCGTLTYEDKKRSGTIFTYGMIGGGALLIVVNAMKVRKKK